MDVSRFVGSVDTIDGIQTKTRHHVWSLRRLLIAFAVGLLLIVVALYVDYWWNTGRFLVSTDDAYVQAHSVLISPHISGYISEVPVDDNQRVKAGEVLARIDPRDYQTALAQARANVVAAQASVDTLNQQIAQQKLTVEQAGELVASDQAALTFSQQDFQRYTRSCEDRLRHCAEGAAGALWYGLPKAPMQLGLLRDGDWRGIALMAVGLAAFQTVLDDGNVYDWLGSPFIVKLSLVAATALCVFVVLEFLSPAPLVNFRLLGRRNCGLGTLGNFLLGFALYGSSYLLPQYLAVTQGFDAEQSGEVVAWTGLPQLLVIPLVPLLMKRIDARILVGTGLFIFAASCFMNVELDLDYAAPQLFWPNVVRALAQAIVMTPISAIAMVGITPAEAGAVSGLFNMMRNLGGAIGTAAIETFFTKREQFHSFIIDGHVSLLAAGHARSALPICSNISWRTGSPTPPGRCTAP